MLGVLGKCYCQLVPHSSSGVAISHAVLFMMVRAGTAYGHLFHAAGQFCENQLKACSPNASIRRMYRHFFFSKKSTAVMCGLG